MVMSRAHLVTVVARRGRRRGGRGQQRSGDQDDGQILHGIPSSYEDAILSAHPRNEIAETKYLLERCVRR